MSTSQQRAERPTVASQIPVGRSVAVRVPASSGNVGPGYDCLGLALSVYDDVRVTRIPEGLEFVLTGEGADQVPRSEEHLILRAMAAAWQAAGLQIGSVWPGLRLEAVNRIPHARGMGSSASAIVAGVCAANELLPAPLRLETEQLLQVCSALEGHPDNVAPSLQGGLVISWEEPGGIRSASVAVRPEVTPVVAMPDYEVSTRRARELVPQQVPHSEAAMNSGRSALLIHALSCAPDLLLPATRDWLHQDHRAEAMGPSAALMGHLRSHGFPAMISGAGPTVLVLAESPESAAQAVACIAAGAQASDEMAASQRIGGREVSWHTTTLTIDAAGAMIDSVDD